MSTGERPPRLTAGEIEDAVARLFLDGAPGGLPRRRRDRLALLGAAWLGIAEQAAAGDDCSEAELNDALQTWLYTLKSDGPLDHVSLRRALVDEGLLERDAPGRHYGLVKRRFDSLFDSSVTGCDPRAAVLAARSRRDARRRAWRKA
jgi:hypothetical protein